MKRATITIPDDLEGELSAYMVSRDAPPSLAALVQTALRRYLAEHSLTERGYRPPKGPFAVTPSDPGSGQGDVAAEHDRHLAERE